VVADTSTHDLAVTGEEYDGVRDALWSAVSELPDRQRAVVVLRYYEQLSEQETAEALGVSVGTVKSQASRAIGTLRTHLSGSSWDRDDLTGWEAHR